MKPIELIGNTPLVEIQQLNDGEAKIYAKLESKNLTGSVKDRVALQMIEDAEAQGKLQPGSMIVEPTSGNTGVGLAAVAAMKGYACTIVMPETMSQERRTLMQAYGAKIILTPGDGGMKAAIAKAQELVAENDQAYLPDQFGNPSNPKVHYKTTGPEIWEQTGGQVDVFIAGVGTGGTLTGVGRYLREQNPKIELIAVEPAESPVLSQGKTGTHGIQGIGAGFVPDVLDTDLYDRVITVKTEDAKAVARSCGAKEGFLVGISSGAVLWATLELSRDPAYHGKTLVTLLPDGGDRYLSTDLYH